jgi:hypothetical protein
LNRLKDYKQLHFKVYAGRKLARLAQEQAVIANQSITANEDLRNHTFFDKEICSRFTAKRVIRIQAAFLTCKLFTVSLF